MSTPKTLISIHLSIYLSIYLSICLCEARSRRAVFLTSAHSPTQGPSIGRIVIHYVGPDQANRLRHGVGLLTAIFASGSSCLKKRVSTQPPYQHHLKCYSTKLKNMWTVSTHPQCQFGRACTAEILGPPIFRVKRASKSVPRNIEPGCCC